MSINGALVRLSDDDLAWLRGYRPDGADQAGDRTASWFFADNPQAYELEGAFVGVHFLLTGTASGGDGPLSFVANAAFGEPVPYDRGHGPGRILAPTTVAAIADAIESMTARDVRSRLESDALSACHPFAGRRLEDDDKEWLLAVLQGLMTFMRRAAKDRVPVLVVVV